jgi:hypothetical protein
MYQPREIGTMEAMHFALHAADNGQENVDGNQGIEYCSVHSLSQ